MTGTDGHPVWVDDLDRKLSDQFPGRVVRKDLVQRLKVGFSIPVYVLEYLLGKYCSTTDEAQIETGLASVKEMIAERIVRSDQGELIKARLQRFRSMKLIDMITVTFDEKDQGGKYWAKLATCGLDKIHIDERLTHQYERMLTGGVWANLELAYDDSITHAGVTRPFVLKRMQPIQIASASLDEFVRREGPSAARNGFPCSCERWAMRPAIPISPGGESCSIFFGWCRWSSTTTT